MDIIASGQPALEAAADHLLIFATKDDDILDGGALRQLNDALDGGLAPLVEPRASCRAPSMRPSSCTRLARLRPRGS